MHRSGNLFEQMTDEEIIGPLDLKEYPLWAC